jgi:hypothetical protein
MRKGRQVKEEQEEEEPQDPKLTVIWFLRQ